MSGQRYQSDQYLRKWQLSLGGTSQIADPLGAVGGLVLTTETPGYDFRMTFRIRHADFYTPGTAEIRIYNLADTTANNVINEYKTVQLQAGYVNGHYGVIFQGTIKQYKRGRESAVDSYLDIFAADGDMAWNYGFLNKTLVAPVHDKDVQKAIADGAKLGDPNLQDGQMAADSSGPADFSGGQAGPGSVAVGGITMPRDYVLWGMAVDEARSYGKTKDTTWSIQNGKIQNLPSTAYAQGDIVVLNAGTGMISAPEVTQDGIFVRCLLNPNLYVKGRIQLDNKSLNQFFAPGGAPLQGQPGSVFPQYTGLPPFFATTAEDGIYCILVIDHEGDTRGLPWYSNLVCLNVNPSNPYDNSVGAGDWSAI